MKVFSRKKHREWAAKHGLDNIEFLSAKMCDGLPVIAGNVVGRDGVEYDCHDDYTTGKCDYVCLECKGQFDIPVTVTEKYGLDTPPYDVQSASPCCAGAYAEYRGECHYCGEVLTADDCFTEVKDRLFCNDCVSRFMGETFNSREATEYISERKLWSEANEYTQLKPMLLEFVSEDTDDYLDWLIEKEEQSIKSKLKA